VERLSSRVLLVAAAGNHGNVGAKPEGYPGPWPKRNSALWPAAFTDVIAVGATDAEGTVAPFTPDVRWIDAYVPGVDLLSTFVNARVERSAGDTEFSGFARWSGTSFAAAVLSGLIAAKVHPGSGSAREAAMRELAEGTRDDQGRLLIEAPLRG
jgi:membrane-anchored mycosin MYCP